MLLKPFFLEKISHASYILAGKEACAVVDPRRDAEIYIDAARSLGVKITHILQTHLHADFISGHLELAGMTGARIHVAASARCRFEHVPVADGSRITIEDMVIDVIETPGHTPEHLSYVVTDTARGESPVGVFVGDTLFVGDVGRPDLFPDQASALAERLYDSLHEKLLALPDYCEIYPAHGAGSLCGRAMGDRRLSTVGYERRYNTALQIRDRAAFVRSLTSHMPPVPDHFGRCSDINREGPAPLSALPAIEELGPARFEERLRDRAVVLDIRSYSAFAGSHIPGAWHLDLNGNFPTFAGWVLPGDRDILLVADRYSDVVDAVRWARRVGVDRIVGCLDGGMVEWVNAGKRVSGIRLISAEALHERITGTAGLVLVDVRAPSEFSENHIEGAVNIQAPDLRTRHRELDAQKPVALICSSGNRSSLAASMLKSYGFAEVYNVAGGMTAYSAAGYAKRCSVCENPHGSRFGAV